MPADNYTDRRIKDLEEDVRDLRKLVTIQATQDLRLLGLERQVRWVNRGLWGLIAVIGGPAVAYILSTINH